MVQISTEYAHDLQFIVDHTEVLAWRCDGNGDSSVRGAPAVDGAVVCADCMHDILDSVSMWIERLQSPSWGLNLVKGRLGECFSEQKWPDATTRRQEVRIGDLVWEVQQEVTNHEYTLRCTAFDITWAEFLWFVAEWERFAHPGGK